MSCYYPLRAWRAFSEEPNPKTGKYPIVFTKPTVGEELFLPCGQCIGCRLARSRDWALRCMHEFQVSGSIGAFLTLTYNNDYLSDTLTVTDWQLFMKRLRSRISPLKCRFFMCGEYGDIGHRPHYHAIIFGYDFPDKQLFKLNFDGSPLYISPLVSDIWPYGFHTIGSVTFESAAYVSRYIMKKHLGKDSFYFYNDVDTETGEILHSVMPEFTLMSRRPGIARDWIKSYHCDVFPHGYCMLHERKLSIPRYYKNFLESSDPDLFLSYRRVLTKRLKSFTIKSPERLTVERLSLQYRLDRLVRKEL